MQETQEMWVLYLGQEDPLEEKMATHSSILAWEIPWTKRPGGLQSMVSQRVGHNWATSLLSQERVTSFLCMGRCKSLGSLKTFFDMHLNHLGPVSLFSPSWIPSGCTYGCGCSGWWLDGCNNLCLLIFLDIHCVQDAHSHKYRRGAGRGEFL